MPEIDGHAIPAESPEYAPDSGSSSISDVLDAPLEAATSAANRAAQTAQQAIAADKPGSGPGFAFDHNQLTSIAERWGELADGFRDDAETAAWLAHTLPPGNEYASINNVETIHGSSKVMGEGLKSRMEYCEAQRDKFLKAAGEYQQTEEQTQFDINGQYEGIV